MQHGAVFGVLILQPFEHAPDIGGKSACSASATSSRMVSMVMRFFE